MLWLGRLGLLAASFCVCLSLLEAAVRILAPPPPFGPWFDLRPYRKLRLEPNLPGVAGPVTHSANKWGMRGEDPPADWDGAFTVITVGGSTTQCFYLDDTRAWPQVLQDRLRAACPRAWVGNAGLDGHSTRGHKLLMEAVIAKLRPDMVIFLVGVNDLALSVAFGEAGSPWDESLARRIRGGGLRGLFDRSRLLQILAAWKRVAEGETRVAVVNHARYVPKPLEGPEDSLPPPERLSSLAPFLRNLDTLAARCRALGARPVFLTQPGLFSADPKWRAIQGGMSFLRTSRWHISAATEYRLLRVFNDSLLSRCAALKADCFDLAARIPHDSAYFYDDYHFTDRGARAVGEAVAGFLSGLPRPRECGAERPSP
jgi:lysophospholipase L1-like esterase